MDFWNPASKSQRLFHLLLALAWIVHSASAALGSGYQEAYGTVFQACLLDGTQGLMVRSVNVSSGTELATSLYAGLQIVSNAVTHTVSGNRTIVGATVVQSAHLHGTAMAWDLANGADSSILASAKSCSSDSYVLCVAGNASQVYMVTASTLGTVGRLVRVQPWADSCLVDTILDEMPALVRGAWSGSGSCTFSANRLWFVQDSSPNLWWVDVSGPSPTNGSVVLANSSSAATAEVRLLPDVARGGVYLADGTNLQILPTGMVSAFPLTDFQLAALSLGALSAPMSFYVPSFTPGLLSTLLDEGGRVLMNMPTLEPPTNCSLSAVVATSLLVMPSPPGPHGDGGDGQDGDSGDDFPVWAIVLIAMGGCCCFVMGLCLLVVVTLLLVIPPSVLSASVLTYYAAFRNKRVKSVPVDPSIQEPAVPSDLTEQSPLI